MMRTAGPALAVVWATAVFAQPAFRTVSIRVSTAPDALPGRNIHADGFDAVNSSLRNYLVWAFALDRTYQVSGPGWLSSEKFDISAQASGRITPEELRSMLRTLLAERFHLTAHRETRLLPGYSVVVGKGGLKIQPVPKTAAPPRWRPSGEHSLVLPQATFQELAGKLEGYLGCPIEDATHLEGVFDFDFGWTPDPGQQDAAAAGEDLPTAPNPGEGPSLFEVLEGQIGVRVEGRKLPVEVLVIDHIDKSPKR